MTGHIYAPEDYHDYYLWSDFQKAEDEKLDRTEVAIHICQGATTKVVEEEESPKVHLLFKISVLS